MAQYLIVAIRRGERFPPAKEIAEQDGDGGISLGWAVGVGDAVPIFCGPYRNFEEARAESEEMMRLDVLESAPDDPGGQLVAYVFPFDAPSVEVLHRVPRREG